MNKKIILGIFGIAILIVSLVISILIDPVTRDFSTSLMNFHKNSEVIYVDGLLKDEFLPKIDEKIASNAENTSVADKLKAYKETLSADIAQLTDVVTKEVEPNIVLDLQKTNEATLIQKTKAAMLGIGKLVPTIEKIKKEVPAELSDVFAAATIIESENDGKTVKTDKLQQLVTVYNDVNPIFSGMGTKKWIRFLLIVLVAAAAATVFIFIERKARATGEIKPNEVA